MTVEIGLLLAIVASAAVLFAVEAVSADVVALGVLLALIATGLVTPAQAFSGFGSDAVLMIFGLLVMSAALLRTGVVDIVGRALLRRAGRDPARLVVWIMVVVATLSAFISNTAATAFFLPITVGLAARAQTSPSRLLLPLAFASILSSSVTLISTSTNIVVSDVMSDHGLAPMGLFELAPVGLPIALVGLLYMVVVGQRLLPARTSTPEEESPLGVKAYLTEVMVLPGSPFVGKTLTESGLGRELDLTVLRVMREKDRYFAPHGSMRLQAGDVLLVEGARDDVLKVKDVAGIDIKADVKLSDPTLQSEEGAIVEAIVLPRSSLIGRTLKSVQFRERYGLQVLAIDRHGATIHRKISEVRLQMGDLLLVQGRRENLAAVEGGDAFRILGTVEGKRPNLRRAAVAVAVFAGALAAGAARIVPLPVATLFGAFLVFVTRCITPEEAYRQVEWKAIVLIACMLSLGVAMTETGAAEWLAGGLVDLLGTSSFALLTGFFVLTVVLTQPMSNQAAAVVVLPIALHAAASLGYSARTFAMMVAVAASCSYLTPLEPSCLMVYGPGRYRFTDFLKVGGLLTLIIYGIAIVLVPLVWPL
jgi:di/tricarboxylate transporter